MEPVVLEAKTVGSGQTRNTTAKITSQHGLIYHKLLETLGVETARAYAEANQRAIQEYERIIREHRINCWLSAKFSISSSSRKTSCLTPWPPKPALKTHGTNKNLIHLLEYFEVSQSSSQTVVSHDNAVTEAFFLHSQKEGQLLLAALVLLKGIW